MKISIIVPVHNAAPYIERCITSLTTQTEDVEIILVENNSTDNSAEICEQYSVIYKNLIYIKANEIGVSNARNQGIKIATGEIIGFCDADDMYEVNILTRVIDIFNRFAEVDIVVSGFYECPVGKKNLRVYPNSGLCRKELLFPLLINDNRIMGSVWNKFFRKEVIHNILFDAELIYCEDTHFVARVLDSPQTRACYILDIPTYYYFINANSVTNSPDKVFNKESEANIIVALRKISLDCDLTDKQKNEISYAITRFAADILGGKQLTEEQKRLLIRNIKDNLGGYMRLMFKYGMTSKYALKTMIKRFFVILKFCMV